VRLAVAELTGPSDPIDVHQQNLQSVARNQLGVDRTLFRETDRHGANWLLERAQLAGGAAQLERMMSYIEKQIADGGSVYYSEPQGRTGPLLVAAVADDGRRIAMFNVPRP
jgi:hypothetical protein